MIRTLIAVGAAVAVLAAIVLAYAATSAGSMDDMGAATLLALGAVFLGQALVALARRLDRPE